MSRTLYRHQRAALRAVRATIRGKSKHVVVSMPTGAGKTLFAIRLILETIKAGKKVVFTVPKIELVRQTINALVEEGLPARLISVLQADDPRYDEKLPVQVVSVQTLSRRGLTPKCDLVIVDECHEQSHHMLKWMAANPRIPFVGLSATPWASQMGDWWNDLLQPLVTVDAIEQGILTPFRTFARATADLSDVEIVAGDYNQGQLSDAMTRAENVTADIVRNWIKKGENRPTFCFCVSRKHARSVSRRFLRAGVSAGYMDAFTPETERDLLREDFHSGKVKVICNVGVLTTGIDWDVRCIIMARPTYSKILWVQTVGRGLRVAKRKKDCLIFDHTDNTLNLGFVSNIVADRLHKKGERRDGIFKLPPRGPKTCKECGVLVDSGVEVCPECGYRFPKRESMREKKDVALVEIAEKPKRKFKFSNRHLHLNKKGNWAFVKKERGVVTYHISLGGRNVQLDEALRRAELCESLIAAGKNQEEIRLAIKIIRDKKPLFEIPGLALTSKRLHWRYVRRMNGVDWVISLGSQQTTNEHAAKCYAKKAERLILDGTSLADVRRKIKILREGASAKTKGLSAPKSNNVWLWVRTYQHKTTSTSLGSRTAISETEAKNLAAFCNRLLEAGKSQDEIRIAVARKKERMAKRTSRPVRRAA